MAKTEEAAKPAEFVNANRADLILPDGTVIADGETVTLSADALDNLGVQMWIEAGLLQPVI